MRTIVVQTDDNKFNVVMKDMTEGKLMAISQALKDYSEKSIVCNDVRVSFTNAIVATKQTKKFLKRLNDEEASL